MKTVLGGVPAEVLDDQSFGLARLSAATVATAVAVPVAALGAGALGTDVVQEQSPAAQLRALHLLHGCVHMIFFGELDESKSTRKSIACVKSALS